MKLGFIILAVTFSLAFPFPASAKDHKSARDFRQRDAMLPFDQILAAARQSASNQAQFLDAQIVRGQQRERLVRIFFRENDGRVISVLVDGRRAAIIEVSKGDRNSSTHGKRKVPLPRARPSRALNAQGAARNNGENRPANSGSRRRDERRSGNNRQDRRGQQNRTSGGRQSGDRSSGGGGRKR